MCGWYGPSLFYVSMLNWIEELLVFVWTRVTQIIVAYRIKFKITFFPFNLVIKQQQQQLYSTPIRKEWNLHLIKLHSIDGIVRWPRRLKHKQKKKHNPNKKKKKEMQIKIKTEVNRKTRRDWAPGLRFCPIWWFLPSCPVL